LVWLSLFWVQFANIWFGLVRVLFAKIWFGFSPPSSLRLPTHADYINAAAAQRLGELQANALANSENPFSIDGKIFAFLLGLITFLVYSHFCTCVGGF
jgi:hypothetical protein